MHYPNLILPAWLLMVFAAASPNGTAQPGPEAPTYAASPGAMDTLEAKLMGTWVLAKATMPGNPSGICTRLKIFSPGRWEMIQKDPKTGEIIFHHGGTYRLNGDILEQKVEFASQKTRGQIGQVRRFRITVEEDTYTQTGIGNPFNELWERLDAA